MQPPPIPRAPVHRSSKAWVWWTLGLGFLLALALFTVWQIVLARRGMDVARIVGPDAVLAVHLRDTRRDPGVRQIIVRIRRIQQRLLREHLRDTGTPGLEVWRDSLSGLEQFVPASSTSLPEAVVALEPDAGGTNVFTMVAAVRIGGMARLAASFTLRMLGHSAKGSASLRTYRGQKLTDLGGNGWLAFSRGMLLYAQERAALERLLDRLASGDVPESVTSRLPVEKAAPWDLVLVGSNQQTALLPLPDYLKDRWDGPAAWKHRGKERAPHDTSARPEAVEWGWVGLDVHTGDWIRGRIRWTCREESDAAAWAERLKEWIEPRLEPLQTHQLGVMLTHGSEGREAHVDLDVTNVERAMENAFAKALQRSAEASSASATDTPPAPRPEAP